MKKLLFLCLFIVPLIFFITLSFNNKKEDAIATTAAIQMDVQSKIELLDKWYDNDWQAVLKSKNEQQLQASFLRGRKLYKNVEWAVEFFFPSTAKNINGAPLPEIEVEEYIVTEPSGFGVIEEYIFPYEKASDAELERGSKKLKSIINRLHTLWSDVQFRDDQVWAALRLQLMRIASLGLSGFDTPLSLSAIQEIKYSLTSMQKALNRYKADAVLAEYAAMDKLFQKAFIQIEKNKSFTLFDRAYFIEEVLRPLTHQVFAAQQKLSIEVKNVYAVNMQTASFFDSAAFNKNFFTPDASAWMSDEKIHLGKMLFHNPVLSLNGSMACVSCHQPGKAFTDGMTKNKSSSGADLKRNTPTLLYAGLQQKQFYDMRASYLEDQVRNVIESKDEIHGSLPMAAKKLSKNKDYTKVFQKAFNSTADTVTEWQIQVALASYIRSLAPFTSKFDKYLQGKQPLSITEKEGFNLFMGKAKCGSCHFMPVFNGTIPPQFTATESEVLGTPADKQFSMIDNDKGRYEIYKIKELKSAFKTPTLRNVAKTAPYMHNGVFSTLDEVLLFYNEGGAAGREKSLNNQTLPADKLNLSKDEISKIIAFMQALND